MTRDLEDIRQLDTPLIVYAGPEISAAAGLPDLHGLAELLLAEAADYLAPRALAELRALAAGPDFGDALTELERTLTPATFGDIVERALADDDRPLPALATAIAGLAPRLRGVISPNLDILLERAFAGELTTYPRPTLDLASRKHWLLKLHGALHDRSTWILTGEQRARAVHRDPVHRDLFRSLFLAHPILFVGTDLNDALLVELTGQIAALARGQPPRHWALVDAAAVSPLARRKFAAAGIRLIGYPDEPTRLQWLAELADARPTAPTPTLARPVAPRPPEPPAPAPAPAPAQSLSLLFLTANPAGTDAIRVDRELRIIRDALERSRHRDRLRVDIRTAATVHDLRRALLDADHHIIHISGHGEQQGLLLEDEQGQCVLVPVDALARLFARQARRGNLRCVLFNACWSRALAESPAWAVPFAIAMDGQISDVAALEFSRGFYDALGAGQDVLAAYDEGMTCVDLAAPGAPFACQMVRKG